MATRANLMITDGTRENAILLTRFFDGTPAIMGIELVDYLRDQSRTKHGRERLHRWTSLAFNLQNKFTNEYSREKEFTPGGDISFFYIVNTGTQTLTCYWCMSLEIPSDHYFLMMENKPRMAKAVVKSFSVPFTATREELAEAADKQIRNVKAKNDTLKDLHELKEFNGVVFPYETYHTYYERLIKTIRGEDARVKM